MHTERRVSTVQVLGTFITEWEAGAATCASAFSSMAAAEAVCAPAAPQWSGARIQLQQAGDGLNKTCCSKAGTHTLTKSKLAAAIHPNCMRRCLRLQVAERLAGIAARYAFEGWLVNIENGMQPEHVVRLRHFLRCGAGPYEFPLCLARKQV